MEKQHYDFLPDLENPSNVHRIEMDMIPADSLVLDIGCHTGIMGEVLRQAKHAKIVGIDTDVNALAIAKQRLEAVMQVDIEQPEWATQLSEAGYTNFDVILFGDVLEHTRAPERILLEAKKLLGAGGRIIVSLPNVANLRIRLGLLRGKFDYTESGILDRTHLRFFTIKSAKELIEVSGYTIIGFDLAGYSLPHWLIRLFPGLFAVQIVICATPQ
ncbi:MAG: methionine biosynthesis protein MetW [Ignavibacteriota bacterium]